MTLTVSTWRLSAPFLMLRNVSQSRSMFEVLVNMSFVHCEFVSFDNNAKLCDRLVNCKQKNKFKFLIVVAILRTAFTSIKTPSLSLIKDQDFKIPFFVFLFFTSQIFLKLFYANFYLKLCVVYFDQRLGAAHCKQ